jgi:hypothetical protein
MKIIKLKSRRVIVDGERTLTFTCGYGRKFIANIPKSQIINIEKTKGYYIIKVTDWIYSKIKDDV